MAASDNLALSEAVVDGRAAAAPIFKIVNRK